MEGFCSEMKLDLISFTMGGVKIGICLNGKIGPLGILKFEMRQAGEGRSSISQITKLQQKILQLGHGFGGKLPHSICFGFSDFGSTPKLLEHKTRHTPL